MSSIPIAFTLISETISVLQHALQIARALKEMQDSPEDYQQLSNELDVLKEVLDVAEDIYNKKTLLSSLQRAFQYSFSMCLHLLKEFTIKNVGFERRLGEDKPGYGFRSVPRRIGWVLFRKDDVVSLRRKLHQQQTYMAIILGLNTTDVLSEFRKSLDFLHEEHRNLAGELAEMRKRMSIDQRELRDLLLQSRVEQWDMFRAMSDMLRAQQGSTSQDTGQPDRNNTHGVRPPALPSPTDHGVNQPFQTRHGAVCSGPRPYQLLDCALGYGKGHPQYTSGCCSTSEQALVTVRVDWFLM